MGEAQAGEEGGEGGPGYGKGKGGEEGGGEGGTQARLEVPPQGLPHHEPPHHGEGVVHAFHMPPVEGRGQGLGQEEEEKKGQEGYQKVAQEKLSEEAHPPPGSGSLDPAPSQ